MTAGELVTTEARRDEIVAWRFSVLLRAGYGYDESLLLAMRKDVDLHLAVELTRRGCPPATALRILS
jgi:hypothetical protein